MEYRLQNQTLFLLTTEECLEQYQKISGFSSLQRTIRGHNLEYCKVEMHEGYIIGTLLVPDKENPNRDLFSFSVYMDKNKILLIDDMAHRRKLQEMLQQGELLKAEDIPRFISKMIAYLIRDDMSCLQSYEERLSYMEEQVTAHFSGNIHRELQRCRRELLILNSYFLQMMDVCDTLEDNLNLYYENNTSVRAYGNLSNRINNLYGHARMLREYALQVREMYQSQVDIRQNDTIRFLTVVTTIFFPLSLITGWYGMNFVYMPELKVPYAYGTLAVICLIIVIIEIIIFKRKDWL